MSKEINQVTVERDNGHSNRWAFSRWFYRREGQKESLSTRRLTVLLGIVFLASAIFLLVRAPSQEIAAEAPIALEADSMVTASAFQNIPEFRPELSQAPKSKGTAPTKFKGIEHVGRPRLVSIPPGTTGLAVLAGAATDGKVRAELTEDVVFNGETLLPKGAKLIGAGSSGEDRLTISFSKIVFKDGATQNISAEAADPEDQVVGLKGSKVSKYAAMVAAAGALSFAGGVAEGMQETENQGGVAVKKANLKNAALNGAARATLDVGSEIVTSWKNKKSVIVVKEGSALLVVFDSN